MSDFLGGSGGLGGFQRFRLWMWTRRARRLAALGRYNDAAAWCEMALEMDRAHAPAREVLEDVRAVALAQAVAAADAEPSLAAELEAVAWAVETERPPEAAAHARRATRIFARTGEGGDPPPELMLARGEAAYLNGAHERAVEALEKACRLGGAGGFVGIEATYYLGLAHLALGQRDRALARFRFVARKYPWFATDRLADCLEKAGQA